MVGGRKREVVGDEDRRLAGNSGSLKRMRRIVEVRGNPDGCRSRPGRWSGRGANDAGRADPSAPNRSAMSIDVRLGSRVPTKKAIRLGATHKGGQSRRSHDTTTVDGSGFRSRAYRGHERRAACQNEMYRMGRLGMLPRRSSSVCIFTSAALDRCGSAPTELRPGQAQSDGRRVQGVDGIPGQVQPQASSST